MITEKENLRRFYAHEKPDHYPRLENGLYTLVPSIPIRPLQHSTVDWYGVHYKYDSLFPGFGIPCEPWVVRDITRWREQVAFPDYSQIDWAAQAARDEVGPAVRQEKLLSILLQCTLYERFHSLMGMENALLNLLEEPEESLALLEAICENRLALVSRIIDCYKPDIVRCNDDYGSQRAMQMSPALWREMFKPLLKKLVDLCHGKGVFFELHCCGLVEPIVEDFAEIGIDSWQGMQINDVPKLQAKTNGRLLYHMRLSTGDYYAADQSGNLTEMQLREKIRGILNSCVPGGCYFHTPVGGAGVPADWWGLPVIEDEIERFRREFQYD